MGLFRTAFTLIELLVVIAILALLVAIMLPVTTKGIKQARRAQCASNQRQFFLACLLYSDDHEGLYPDAVTQNGDLSICPIPAHTPTPWLQEVLEGYLADADEGAVNTWKCPSVKVSWLKNDPASNHYRYNCRWAAGVLQDTVVAPSDAALLFDASWQDWPLEDLPHEGVNIVYADGHVEYVAGTLFLENMVGDLDSVLMSAGWQ